MWIANKSLTIPKRELSLLLRDACASPSFPERGALAGADVVGAIYWSSAAVQRLRLRFENGGPMTIFLKGQDESRAEKERQVCEALAGEKRAGMPVMYASQCRDGRVWMCFEDVGDERVNLNDYDCWLHGADRLARIHSIDPAVCAGILQKDSKSRMARWARASLEAVEKRRRQYGPMAVDACDLTAFRRVADAADQLAETALLDKPVILHGNYVSKNLVVQRRGGRVRIRPIDWEDARIGAPAFDLIELAMGYEGPRREAIIQRYIDGRRKYGDFEEARFLTSMRALEALHLIEEAKWAVRRISDFADYGPQGAGRLPVLAAKARGLLDEI